MKLSMSEKEFASTFNTFTSAVKQSAEQTMRADRLQVTVNDLTGKLGFAERALEREKENHRHTSADLNAHVTANAGYRDTIRGLDLTVSKLKKELEQAQKKEVSFTPAQLADVRKAIAEGLAVKLAEVVSAMRSGRKIPAIAIIRDVTGASLKESKDLIEEGIFPESLRERISLGNLISLLMSQKQNQNQNQNQNQ